ncbi:MAG: DNA polymerase IV, partial [Verrucomicrobia bacterium]|nr:DNA polymerase IV [Verrucomicrobiota bacterium]
GPKSAERLMAHGIHTCGDLQKFTLIEMAQQFGKWGEELFHLCRGEDDRFVDPNWVRKSLSNEKTFSDNLTSLAECEAAMVKLAEEALKDVKTKASDRQVRKAFVTIKFSDFTRTTKECICPEPTPAVYRTLLVEAYARKKLPVRLLGAGVRFLEEEGEQQLDLFE